MRLYSTLLFVVTALWVYFPAWVHLQAASRNDARRARSGPRAVCHSERFRFIPRTCRYLPGQP